LKPSSKHGPNPPTFPQIPYTLPSGKIFFYTASMDNLTTGLILTLGTILVYTIVQKWWRRRQAAKLADKLLADVIKGKDAFRR
jgi:hypothetical protein